MVFLCFTVALVAVSTSVDIGIPVFRNINPFIYPTKVHLAFM